METYLYAYRPCSDAHIQNQLNQLMVIVTGAKYKQQIIAKLNCDCGKYGIKDETHHQT